MLCCHLFWKVRLYYHHLVAALLTKFPLGLTYVQGYRARSWVEYSLLKKYFTPCSSHSTSCSYTFYQDTSYSSLSMLYSSSSLLRLTGSLSKTLLTLLPKCLKSWRRLFKLAEQGTSSFHTLFSRVWVSCLYNYSISVSSSLVSSIAYFSQGPREVWRSFFHEVEFLLIKTCVHRLRRT